MQTIPFSNLNATFRRVEEVARVENLSKKERFQYEQDLKVYRDYNNIMMTAKEDGMAQGVAKMLQAMKDSGMDEAMIRQVLSKAGE